MKRRDEHESHTPAAGVAALVFGPSPSAQKKIGTGSFTAVLNDTLTRA
jgi:hypothetical protein